MPTILGEIEPHLGIIIIIIIIIVGVKQQHGCRTKIFDLMLINNKALELGV
jgi:hypothetical protein